jgi:hypothetical protein
MLPILAKPCPLNTVRTRYGVDPLRLSRPLRHPSTKLIISPSSNLDSPTPAPSSSSPRESWPPRRPSLYRPISLQSKSDPPPAESKPKRTATAVMFPRRNGVCFPLNPTSKTSKLDPACTEFKPKKNVVAAVFPKRGSVCFPCRVGQSGTVQAEPGLDRLHAVQALAIVASRRHSTGRASGRQS